MLKVFVFAFIGSILFTWVAIKAALKLKILDYPDKRKMHSNPVPLLGGLAVFMAWAGSLVLNFHFSIQLKGVVIAAFVILVSGLIDDIKTLPASARLVIQILCSLLVVSFGVKLNVVPQILPFADAINIIITIIWIVGITNALNFLDGIDGLASGLVAVIAGTFCIIAIQTGQSYFAYLNIALVGACLGFLLFNFHPAKIFLGDAGSSFFGFCIASFSVMGVWAEKKPIVALCIPLLVLSVLIFDMIYISISRIVSKKVGSFKEWIEYVGKDHLHHRLIGMGFTQVQSVFFILMINIVLSIAALVLMKANTQQALLLVSQGIIFLVIVSILMLAGKKYLDISVKYEERIKEITGRDS